MAYDPTTDFLGLLRRTGNAVQLERMPGLDYVVSALARAGLIKLFVGQSAPTTNQLTTAWFKPSLPTWVAEGVLYLWNSVTGQYEPATQALWSAYLNPPSLNYQFQSVTGTSINVQPGTTLLAIQRVGPVATALTLPNLAAQYATGRKLQIVDYSSTIVLHTITLTTPDGSNIMRSPSFQLFSTPDQLAGVTLTPSPELNAWVITP